MVGGWVGVVSRRGGGGTHCACPSNETLPEAPATQDPGTGTQLLCAHTKDPGKQGASSLSLRLCAEGGGGVQPQSASFCMQGRRGSSASVCV